MGEQREVLGKRDLQTYLGVCVYMYTLGYSD